MANLLSAHAGKLIVPALTGIAYVGVQAWKRFQFNRRHGAAIKALLHEFDNGDNEVEECLGPKDGDKAVPVKGRKYSAVVTAVAQELYVEYGRLEDTPLNRQAMLRRAGECLRAHHVRVAHMARVLPMVVELYFTPSVAETEARMYGASEAFKARKKGVLPPPPR
jgi:hypothetical protein